MIFFFKSDGTLIKSAPETVYQGSAEAGKVYVVAPLNANMLVDVYYELPNGERWGAYLLENNGTVINNEELPDGWALWSTTLESAITQYAGTLKAQFGFYQSGTADKVPLITSQGVTIKIAKGVVRDVFPDSPSPQVYEYITNAVSTILQNFKNLPNEYLENTQEDKIALKNNSAVEYSENATSGTIAKRDSDGKINVVDGTEDLNAVNVGQLNAALANKVDSSSVSATAIKNTIAQRTITGQLKAVDGVADDDLATVKQLNAVQGNYTDITNIDLNTGDTTVEYDTELGITVNAKGTLTHKNGATEQPTTKFELPIVAGDGIVIDKAQNEEKISVKVDGKVTKTPNSIVKRDSAGRVKTADAVSDEDATSYGQHTALLTYTDSELLKKLDRTGGTITGNLIVSGNLSVSGEASVIESTTLKVADKLIYVAKDNTSALTSPAGLITPKYDGTNDGGIVYDNSGTAYVGDIKLDSNGNVDVNNSDLQPIATRDNYSNFTNGHKVKVEVDSLQKSVKFVDGGKDDGINTLTDINLTLGDTTVQYDTTDGIQINSTARFTTQGTNHDAMMDLAIPVVGKDGITIDKAADADKIEISGKNFIPKPASFSDGLYKMAQIAYNDELLYVGVDTGISLNSVAQRTAQGTLSINAPIEDTDAVNKKYGAENYFNRIRTILTPTTGNIISREQLTDLPTGFYWVSSQYNLYDLAVDGWFNIEVFAGSSHATYLVETAENIMYMAQAWTDESRTFTGWVQLATTAYVDKKVDISENFVKVFTIPNGASTGTLAADVKEKLCNPDGHNYYVFDDTSQMILKYSFNEDDEIIQYKALYLVNDKAYDITMQILPSNGSWRRSQTVLNGATANPTLTGTESELTSLKVGGTDYKIPASGGEKVSITVPQGATNGTITDEQLAKLQANENNYIEMVNDKELYYLNDHGHIEGYLTYSHVGIENSKATIKTLTITVSAKSFMIVTTVVPTDAGGKLYLHSLYFPGCTNQPLLTFYHTSLTPVTDEWIYKHLTNNTYCLTFYPSVTSIYQYGKIGLSAQLVQTSNSPSWGAFINLESSGPTLLSVSQAASYIVSEI